MRIQIKNDINMKRIGNFIGQRSRSKSLYICAREGWGGGALLFAFGDRSMEVRADVEEVGSVEIDKSSFGKIFDVFTCNAPIDIWTEEGQVKFRQRNFVTALNVLNEKAYDLFALPSAGMKRRLLEEEKKGLLARLRVIDRELGL